MKKSKILALVLAMVMVVSLFAACGNKEQAPAPAETQGAATETQAAETTPAEEVEDVAEIEILFWTLNTIPNDVDMVEDAINAITEEKISTVVNLNIVEQGAYIEQVNLMMASQEKLDLMVTLPGGPAHFNSLTSQNQLTDITELLNEYGQGILETVPEEWLAGTTIGGKIYSVTSMGDKATPLAFIVRTDILEESGMDPATLTDVEGLTAFFAKVEELHPEMTPLATGTQKILTAPYMIDKETGTFVKYDNLGDGDNALLGVTAEDGTTIVNNYTREDQMYSYQVFKDWYDAGYVYKDGPTYADTQQSLIAGGSCASFFLCVGVGTEASLATTCKHDMTYIWLDESPMIGTGALRKFSWAVPVIATEPEAAVKFMNLLYTDAEILNLFTWGIEGTHYQTLEDGTIDFLEGQDASNCGYYTGGGTSIWGNGFLAKVRAGQPVTLREDTYKMNMNAEVSKFLGFAFDTTGLENEISLMTNAIEEYRPSFQCGLYTDDYYNEFMKKMEASGVDKYFETIQSQFDAWLAENK